MWECSARGRWLGVSPEAVVIRGPQLESSEGLSGAGIPASFCAWQVSARWQEASVFLSRGPLCGLLECLRGVAASFPHMVRSKRGESCNVFYDLISDVTLCHSHDILLVILLVVDRPCFLWKVTTHGCKFTSPLGRPWNDDVGLETDTISVKSSDLCQLIVRMSCFKHGSSSFCHVTYKPAAFMSGYHVKESYELQYCIFSRCRWAHCLLLGVHCRLS